MTDLTLEYLDRQREHPDPELLKKLKWTPEQLREFADRWRKAKEEAQSDPRKQKELDDALRSLRLAPSQGSVRSLDAGDDRIRGLQDDGVRVRPPESLREQIQQFRKAMQGKKN